MSRPAPQPDGKSSSKCVDWLEENGYADNRFTVFVAREIMAGMVGDSKVAGH